MSGLIWVAIGLFCGVALALASGRRSRRALIEQCARSPLLEQQLTQLQVQLVALREEHAASLRALHAEVALRAAAEARSARIPQLEQELDTQRHSAQRLQSELSELSARAQEQAASNAEKLRMLSDAESALGTAFQALSAQALERNNQSFLQLASTSLAKFQQQAHGDLEAREQAVSALVSPIRDSLEKVDFRLIEMERLRESAYSSLNEQLRGLVETHLPMLRSETTNLVKALRQPSVRGRWGEIQLRRVVEMAGMLEHCDFLEQESTPTEEGRRRPDLIVKLPGGKQIIIDAKAPVSAYLEATEAADDETRQRHLVRHAQQVRTHMSALGRKSYWDAFARTPEIVILFLPGEMFFSAALQQDPALIEFGVNEKVLPATPTTLIALLRAVAYGWRQEALNVNAEQVAALGKELYERICTLASHWSDVGRKLDGAVTSYNKSVVSLEARLLVSARKLRELKVTADEREIEGCEPVESTPRALQSPEMTVHNGPAAQIRAV